LPYEAFKNLCCMTEADEIIEQYKDHVKPIKRRLTDHITTRPYRAPEVIFLEKNYHSGVDIWATGIIIFELFKYLSMS
jgi:serine/threonine protein kinase